MKQMTWEDYYDGFYDWAPSTQKSYTYRLSDFGPADEVWEIAQELSFNDNAFAAKFLEKAFAAGVHFTPDQVLEMVGTVEESVLSRMAEQTDVPFNREQLEEIYLMISDNSFQKISRRAHIDVSFLAGAFVASQIQKKHDGHCDGDCANCPPHYGYRYGRWYYGKGHQYGCEFGGNKGNKD